jgi:peptidylprolyl isomerase
MMLSLVACGSGSSDSATVDPANATTNVKAPGRQRVSRFMISRKEVAELPKLKIAKQSGPPPKHLVAIDLRKGSGPTLRKTDVVYVRYFVVSYSQALKRTRTAVCKIKKIGLDEMVKGWEVGLPGMKLGGTRELILPPKMVYPRWKPSWGFEPYVDIYVVELAGLERRKTEAS